MLRVIIFLFLAIPAFSQLQDDIFVQTDRFLKKNVKNGQVNYSEIAKDKKELDALVKRIESVNYTTFFDDLKKAYLINTYNILIIKQVVDKYPIISTNEVKNFFYESKFNINGKTYTLDQFEKDLILKQFTDPRIHFVLIKASNGNPPLPNYSFNPQRINKELDDFCKKILNDPSFIRIGNRKVLLPQIFEWNQKDFNDQGQNMIQFINRFREEKISEDWAIGFYPFDFTLNDSILWEHIQSEKDSLRAKAYRKRDTLQSLQTLTPAKLVPRGRWDFKTSNYLYSQTQAFSNIRRQELGRRESYFTSVNQVLFGQNNKLNVGFEFWVKSVFSDTTSSSALEIFGNKPSKYYQTAITGIGPKFKAKPFKKYPNLTLQTTLLVPVDRDLEGRKSKKPFLSPDAGMLINQLMYDKNIGKKLQIFTQISPILTFGRSTQQSKFSMPISVYLGYLANQSLLVYFQTEANQSFGKGFITNGFLMNGIGSKVQLVQKKLELDLSYNVNSIGYKNGAGSGFNIGLRYLK